LQEGNVDGILLLEYEFEIVNIFEQTLEEQGFIVSAFKDPTLALEM
jgi:hypothetical protein